MFATPSAVQHHCARGGHSGEFFLLRLGLVPLYLTSHPQQFSNVYVVTEYAYGLAEDADLRKDCIEFVSLSRALFCGEVFDLLHHSVDHLSSFNSPTQTRPRDRHVDVL